MAGIEWVTVDCPYCGERFETYVDYSGGDQQHYVEDCQICCSPIIFIVSLDLDGTLRALETRQENQ